jgi:hypothetical protein
VVARSQVADTLCVDAGENVCFSPCRSARSSMAGRPYVRYGSKADAIHDTIPRPLYPKSGHLSACIDVC